MPWDASTFMLTYSNMAAGMNEYPLSVLERLFSPFGLPSPVSQSCRIRTPLGTRALPVGSPGHCTNTRVFSLASCRVGNRCPGMFFAFSRHDKDSETSAQKRVVGGCEQKEQNTAVAAA